MSGETELRPWGSFTVLHESPGVKVKILQVTPCMRTSLQIHRHREETWVVTEGVGVLTVGDHTIPANPGSLVRVPINAPHRIEASLLGLTLIEVQRGTCDEADIVRLSDDHGRL